MTFEEVTRTMEFIVEHQAHASVQMEEFWRGLKDLREFTAKFELWATEVVAIQSNRLDQESHRLNQVDVRLEEERQHREQIDRRLEEDRQHREQIDRRLEAERRHRQQIDRQ